MADINEVLQSLVDPLVQFDDDNRCRLVYFSGPGTRNYANLTAEQEAILLRQPREILLDALERIVYPLYAPDNDRDQECAARTIRILVELPRLGAIISEKEVFDHIISLYVRGLIDGDAVQMFLALGSDNRNTWISFAGKYKAPT